MSFTPIANSQFDVPVPHTSYSLLRTLRAALPNDQHVPTLDCSSSDFPLLDYLSTHDITYTVVDPDTYGFFEYNSDTKKVEKSVVVGVFTFTYGGVSFTAYHASWSTGFGNTSSLYDLVFEGADDALGQELATAVYKWADELKEEIWVFEAGQWIKRKTLFKAIRAASWDDIVLDAAFKEGLRRDTHTFFSSQKIYQSLGITWKRGILLMGPPGNGKTETIKALLNDVNYTALYVKSVTTREGPEYGVREVFKFARKHAPCILVLEDLDAIVTPKTRSFFLNELDGLAQNEGILTIASTNHPERIDDAILNRPSRFDVKYVFDLPNPALRKAFALKWLGKVRAMGADAGVALEKPEDEIASAVAEKTGGWSFAFLKELCVRLCLVSLLCAALLMCTSYYSLDSSLSFCVWLMTGRCTQMLRLDLRIKYSSTKPTSFPVRF
ncbi:P-loop containing nucleoside triphosphate hydrolase protein [Amylocystis lapponica]|nr:P-loop containing nucleoside triphosphate hydrolase protein [Amylocystis lapponica]KAH9949534.1 P-loop containing nucleoside triphosphate hydrolase protein [Amylocystis lapponica]